MSKKARKPCSRTIQTIPDTDQVGHDQPIIHYTDDKYNQGYPSVTNPSKIDCRQSSEQAGTPKQAGSEQNDQNGPVNSGSSPSLPNIPIRQREYVMAITNPDSDTYDNRGLSYAHAYNRPVDNTAYVNGSKLLKSAKIQTWIDDILDRQGAGAEVRVARLNAIASGRAAPRVNTRQILDKRGNKHTVTDTSPPSFADSIRADHLLNKLSGDYDQSRHVNQLSEIEYKALCTRAFKPTAPKVKAMRQTEDMPVEVDEEKTGGRD